MTSAPSRASSSATARPIPDVAPVTSARCPSRVFSLIMGICPLRSVGGVAAVDVEDVAGDEGGVARRDEDDRVGELLREAEAGHRNFGDQVGLVLRRARE